MSHSAYIFLHVVLFGLWFGAHAAILMILRELKQAGDVGRQQRILVLMQTLERIPRSAFVLMLPLGLQLAETRGLFEIAGMGVVGAWIVALVWLVLIWAQPRASKSDMAVGLRTTQRVFMVVVAVIMAGAGILSLLSGAPVGASWLAAKFLLYALAIMAVFGLEMSTQEPLYTAFQQRGSGDLDAAVRTALPRATLAGLALFAALLGAAYIGVVQPAF